MKPFVHLPEQHIVVCSVCKYAVLPNSINAHLRDEPKHKMTVEARSQIAREIQTIEGLIQEKSELNQLMFPAASKPAIHSLQAARIDGMQCLLIGSNGIPCKYISCHRQKIQEHCQKVHKWNNPQKKGRQQAGKMANMPWRSGVHCQHFFVRGPGAQFFEVAKPIEEGPAMPSSDLQARFKIEKAELERQIKEAEEKEKRLVVEGDESREPNPWLRRVGWAQHCGHLDREDLRAFIAPVGEDEVELQVLCKAFDWMIQNAQSHAVREVVGLQALFEVNRKEANNMPSMPFESIMDDTTIEKYTQVWKQVLWYIFRVEDCEEVEKRPGYRLTERQQIILTDVRSCIREFTQWLESEGRDFQQDEQDKIPETYEEIQWLDRIQRKIVALVVTLLDHPLQDNEYHSAIISGLALLGMREDDGWLDAEDYTPKYSAIIKLARLIVVQEAYYQRQGAIQQYTEAGWTQAQAEEKATTYLHRIREMTRRFTIMGNPDRDPSPMQWIYQARSYGFKIRYTTTAAGVIQWKGDEVLYPNARFTMNMFRSMVGGVVGEARELLFEKLMLTRMSADAEIDEQQVPAIHWDQIVDQPSEGRTGHSFLDDSRNQWVVDGQWWLSERVATEPKLYRKFRDAAGEFKAQAYDEYAGYVEKFQELLWACMHFCGGQPARAPELLGMRWKNTVHGGIRNIFIEDGLVAFVAQYHKGYRSSGNIKIIHRYLPREVGELLVYYLWVVLPFWEKMQFKMTGVPSGSPFIWGDSRSGQKVSRRWTGPRGQEGTAEEVVGSVVDSSVHAHSSGHSTPVVEEEIQVVGTPDDQQQQRQFSAQRQPKAWTSERTRRILKSAAMRWMGVRGLNISAYRHIAIAISRRYCQNDQFEQERSQMEEGEVWDEDNVDGDDPWDLQAGHGTHIAGMIYARELMEGDQSIISRREKFRRVSYMWHCWLGFASAHQGVGMSGRAKRKRQVYEEEMEDAQIVRWKRLRSVDIHRELEQMFGSEAKFRGLQEQTLRAIMKHQSPILAIMGTGVGKSLLFQMPARCTRTGTTIVITPLVSLQDHMIERCQKMGITSMKWDPRDSHSSSQIVFVTPESAVTKTFDTFLNRKEGMYELDRIVFDEAHAVLDSSDTFRVAMRQLGKLVDRGVQVVYLTATLSPHDEGEFAQIMGINLDELDDDHKFRDITTRVNIEYSVVEYEMDADGEGEIPAVCLLVAEKLVEYAAPAKVIIYSSEIEYAKKLAKALNCPLYHRTVGERVQKDQIRQAWESGERRVIVATNAFGLGIDQGDVRVVIHSGVIYQMRSYVQESGRAGRDGQRAQAIMMMAAGKQESLQEVFARPRVPAKTYGSISEEEKKRRDKQKVDRFMSGIKCRRVFIDFEMDERMDRVRCEEGEERCDICQESDETTARAEAQQQAYQALEEKRREQEERRQEQSRNEDVVRSYYSNDNENKVSVSEELFNTNMITAADREEFRDIRGEQQRQQVQLRSIIQRGGREVADLMRQLSKWVGVCTWCYVQRCQGIEVNVQHSFDKCTDDSAEYKLAVKELISLEAIEFAKNASCFDCGVAQSICTKWREIADGKVRYRQVKGGRCQYNNIVREVVVCIMISAPTEVVERGVYSWMREKGLWGEELELKASEQEGVQKAMWLWFGEKVQWGGIEASVLLQVFYRLVVELEQWQRGQV